MPSAKTIASELSVACGILQVDPNFAQYNLEKYFDGEEPTAETFQKFLLLYNQDGVYKRFWNLGCHLARYLNRNVERIEWYGVRKQASSSSVSRDLRMIGLNWSVGVKYQSNVVLNSSPYNLFMAIPNGQTKASRSMNWFLECAPSEYRDLVMEVRESYQKLEFKDDLSDLTPADLEEKPRLLQKMMEKMKDRLEQPLDPAKRLALYQKVSQVSAERFNQNLQNVPKNRLTNVHREILRQFLRVNGERYISMGIDTNRRDFILEIPSIDDIIRFWQIESIHARGATAGQSIVKFELMLTNKSTGQRVSLPYRAEIRWSHGVFCGNPEAKLYKEFSWAEVPLFVQIPLSENRLF